MFCWHKWTKWEKYIEKGQIQRHPFSNKMIPYTEENQQRHCLKCGKIQKERIR